MELSKQVISLEIAKKLKGLGVKQESLCSWKPDKLPMPERGGVYNLTIRYQLFDSPPTIYDFSAFTVAELGEMLIKVHYDLPWYSGENTWTWSCMFEDGMGLTEADARGKMLIYLLENKLITL